jgi:hypothetical protein
MKPIKNKAMTPSTLAWTVLLLAASFSPFLKAAIMGIDSIEWLTCSAQIVAVGTLKEIKPVKGPNNELYEDYVLTVTEMIKSPLQKELAFTRHAPGRPDESWKKVGQTLLVFLSQQKDRFTDEQARTLTDGYYFHETRLHKRLVPASGFGDLSLIPLADLPKYLFDKDTHRISDRQALLALCRQWSTSPIKHSIQEWVEDGTDVYQSLFAMSAVFLMVPAEEKHRLRFLQAVKSQDSGLRHTAAAELWKFPGDESEAALRSLLNDTTETTWWRGNSREIDHFEYSVRSAAFNSLKQLGKPVPDLPLRRLQTAEEQRKSRHDSWRQTFMQVLKNGWTVADILDGEVLTKNSRDWTVVEVDFTNGKDKYSLLLIPQPFDTRKTGTMKFLGIRDPYSDSSYYRYASPSMPPDLEKMVSSCF